MSLDPKQIHEYVEGETILSSTTVLEIEQFIGGQWFNKKKTVSNLFIPDQICGFIEAVSDVTYNLILRAPFDGILQKLSTKLSTGTCTVAISIGGTAVTGLSNAATSSIVTNTASADNVFTIGDKIEIEISSSASPEDLDFTLSFYRKIILG